jgi:hypothetical protein
VARNLPRLVDLFCQQAPKLLEEVAKTTSWETVIGAEPALRRMLAYEELDAVLEAIADSPISSLRTRSAIRGALPIWPRRRRVTTASRGAM